MDNGTSNTEAADASTSAADHIMRRADEQMRHRIDRQNRAEARLDRSQRNALIIAIFGLALAAIVTILGGSAVAASVIAIRSTISTPPWQSVGQ